MQMQQMRISWDHDGIPQYILSLDGTFHLPDHSQTLLIVPRTHSLTVNDVQSS